MNTVRNFGFTLLFLASIAGCCQKPYNIFNGEYRYIEYKEDVESLTGEIVDIDDIEIRRTWIADTLLFAQLASEWSPVEPDGWLSVYNLNNNQKLLKHLVLRGRGPNEYSSAETIRFFSDSTGVKAWLLVNSREKIILVNVSASIQKQRLVVEKEIEFNLEDKYASLMVFYDSDTSFVVRSLFNNDQISIYNTVTERTHFECWLYSEEYDYHSRNDMAAIYQYHPHKKILAGGMAFFDQINFYSLNGMNSFSISNNPKVMRYKNIKSIPIEERHDYLSNGCAGNEYLFFGYRPYNEKKDDNIAGVYLRIVSWEGALIKIIRLDRTISGTSFDDRTGYLYGVDWNTDEILRYTIELMP